MKSLNLASLPSTKTIALNGLPRRRPPEVSLTLKSRCGIQTLNELRQLHPAIALIPGTESMFLERRGLTKSRCSHWLHIAKQFYARPRRMLSETVPLENLPPISFLNLLIDWIDGYAKITGRKRNKGPTWRWRALQGFVHDNRRLETQRFLVEIPRLAISIAAHFSKPPFDNHLLGGMGRLASLRPIRSTSSIR